MNDELIEIYAGLTEQRSKLITIIQAADSGIVVTEAAQTLDEALGVEFKCWRRHSRWPRTPPTLPQLWAQMQWATFFWAGSWSLLSFFASSES